MSIGGEHGVKARTQPDSKRNVAMSAAPLYQANGLARGKGLDSSPVPRRRGVLLLTDVVILGLTGSGVYAASSGFMPVAAAVSLIAFLVGLMVLFTASYVAYGRAVRRGRHRRRNLTP